MTTFARLIRTELVLLVREPLVIAFVFAFPIITVLVIAGSFAAEDAPDFGGVPPSEWYVASYIAVVIAAAGFPRWSFAAAQLVVGLVVCLVASGVLLIPAGLIYGLPSLHNPIATLGGVVLGALAFVGVGLALGAVLPSARAAQGIGLVLFFPSFLLGGGGPPPSVMGSTMNRIADVLPLTHVTAAIRQPWLGLGSGSGDVAILLLVFLASTVVWRRAAAL